LAESEKKNRDKDEKIEELEGKLKTIGGKIQGLEKNSKF
jgi:hypothetical protein